MFTQQTCNCTNWMVFKNEISPVNSMSFSSLDIQPPWLRLSTEERNFLGLNSVNLALLLPYKIILSVPVKEWVFFLFSSQFVVNICQTVSGNNAYAVMSSPRAAGTEAIVISASWLSRAGRGTLNLRGTSTVLSLAAFLKGRVIEWLSNFWYTTCLADYSLWAKDIIFIISDDYLHGMHAWLNAYHGTIPSSMSFCICSINLAFILLSTTRSSYRPSRAYLGGHLDCFEYWLQQSFFFAPWCLPWWATHLPSHFLTTQECLQRAWTDVSQIRTSSILSD